MGISLIYWMCRSLGDSSAWRDMRSCCMVQVLFPHPFFEMLMSPFAPASGSTSSRSKSNAFMSPWIATCKHYLAWEKQISTSGEQRLLQKGSRSAGPLWMASCISVFSSLCFWCTHLNPSQCIQQGRKWQEACLTSTTTKILEGECPDWLTVFTCSVVKSIRNINFLDVKWNKPKGPPKKKKIK